MSGIRNRKSILLVSTFAGLAVMAGCTKHNDPAAETSMTTDAIADSAKARKVNEKTLLKDGRQRIVE